MDRQVYNTVMWDTLDFLAEHPLAPTSQVIAGMKDMIATDPEGAARRASGQPQYDHGRAAVGPQYQAALDGDEHGRTPDGGGDSGRPHPEQFALANDCS